MAAIGDWDECCTATVDDMGVAALTRVVSRAERVMVSRCRCRDICAREMNRMSEVDCPVCEDCGLGLIVQAEEGMIA